MRLDEAPIKFGRLGGAMPIAIATVNPAEWSATAQAIALAGHRLIALWGSDRRDLDDGFVVYAAYAVADGLACARLMLSGESPSYPDVSVHFPAANRMQRAAFDMVGLRANGAADERPWLRHGAATGLLSAATPTPTGREVFATEQERYPFVSVSGDGVHEIPVGPIHAGIIEPGHFRFSIVGERCSGWRSGWAMCTRASRSASKACP